MELFFIVALALILLGPKDMAKAGKTIGKWLNDFVRSDTWKVLRETSKTISTLPTQLMREANLEEMGKELKNISPKLPSMDEMEAWANAPEEFRQPIQPDPSVDAPEENSIQPPRSQPFAPEQSGPVIPANKAQDTTGTNANQGNEDNA